MSERIYSDECIELSDELYSKLHEVIKTHMTREDLDSQILGNSAFLAILKNAATFLGTALPRDSVIRASTDFTGKLMSTMVEFSLDSANADEAPNVKH